MSDSKNQKRVLALDVCPRSFGFVVFEGSRQLLDWGVKSFRPGANAVKVPASKKFNALVDEFAPATVVLKERPTETNRRRATLLHAILKQAKNRQLAVRFLTHRVVKKAFAGDERNKYTIASALAKRFPELAPKFPGERKIWQSEDYRMSIFDAAALGTAYFEQKRRSNPILPQSH